MTPHAIALELTLILATWLAIGALQRDHHVPGRLTFAAAAGAVALWVGGNLLSLRADTTLLGLRISMVGALALTPLWFGVAAHSVKLPLIRRTPWLPLMLMAPFVPVYGLLYAGPWSVLFIPTHAVGETAHGPLFWWTLFYAWGLVLAGLGVLIHGAWQADSPDLRRGRARMAASALVPLAANLYWAWQVIGNGSASSEITPMMLAITLLAFRRSILSGGVLDVVPIAQRDIIRHLPFGVVLADDAGVVIDVNPAAEELLDLACADALGRSLEAVISRAPLEVRIEISSVRTRGGESARFALLEAPKAPIPAAPAPPIRPIEG